MQGRKENVNTETHSRNVKGILFYLAVLAAAIVLMISGTTMTAFAGKYENVTVKGGHAGPASTGWLQNADGTWNYLASGSALKSQWQEIGGNWYYFNHDGLMLTGWQDLTQRYYFSSEGKMQKGWQNIDGVDYYFAEDGDTTHSVGALYVNEATPDGNKVDATGAKVDPARPNPTGYANCVEVSIGEQSMYCYRNNQLVLSSPCVTGRLGAHDTTQGVHRIQAKQLDRVLRGTNDNGTPYASPVKYWMPFYNGEGLHDASWRSNFGGAIYTTGGSHGCVNLPTDIAAQLYNLVYVGMPVVVHA